MTENGDILNSWKEIAAYLGRGVRTAQRWEAELHLPVRRPRNKSRSAVMALRTDLDQWIACTPSCEKVGSLPRDPEVAKKILESRLQRLRAEIERAEEDLRQLRLRSRRNESLNEKSTTTQDKVTGTRQDGQETHVVAFNGSVQRARTSIRSSNLKIEIGKMRRNRIAS